jgi:plastocyanin
MATNRIQRTVRMCALSTFLALAALTFLAFGTASAQSLNHTVQSANSSSATFVKIVDPNQGRAVFNPAAITVKSGTTVKIVNKTPYERIVFTNQGTYGLAPNGALKIIVTESQYARICGGGSLTITVS